MPYQFTQEAAEIQDILDLAQNDIAAPYDPTASYVAGDYCTYEDGLYICTGSTTGTFAPAKWSAITVGDALEAQAASISALNATLTNSLWYKSGDTASGQFPSFGYVTGSAGTIDLFLILPKTVPSGATFTASYVSYGGIRTSDGGYIPTAPTVSEISNIVERGGAVMVRAANSGTGLTNNTVLAGMLTITMTMN